jgi:hypothetical protein
MHDNKKKVNVKVMEQIADDELAALVSGLKKIEMFDFFIDTLFRVNQNAAPYFSRLNDIILVRYVDQLSEEGVKWSDE